MEEAGDGAAEAGTGVVGDGFLSLRGFRRKGRFVAGVWEASVNGVTSGKSHTRARAFIFVFFWSRNLVHVVQVRA